MNEGAVQAVADRILGIDYGIKRIGVAVADTELRIAMPLTTLEGRNDAARDARSVADFAEAEEARSFVVGLPLSMDGTDSEQTGLTRRFAAELSRFSARPVALQDERLSSVAADDALTAANAPPAARAARRDSIAAQQILQAYLDNPQHR